MVLASEKRLGGVASIPEPGRGVSLKAYMRGFFNAGWYNEQKGAGIEILDVSVVIISHSTMIVSVFGRLTFVVCAGRHGILRHMSSGNRIINSTCTSMLWSAGSCWHLRRALPRREWLASGRSGHDFGVRKGQVRSARTRRVKTG